MKNFTFLAILALCCSCSVIPHIADDAEKVLDDTAIELKISREVLNQNARLKASIKVNKE
jgi:hypothetical protein